MSQSAMQGYFALIKALRSSAVELFMSGAWIIVVPFSQIRSAPDERCAEFFVDFSNFLYSVDVGLVDALDPAAAAIVAAGTEFTINSACSPQGLVNDADSFFSCGVFDQYGGHLFNSFLDGTIDFSLIISWHFGNYSAHRKKDQKWTGELARRNVFDLFSGADKAPFRREDALCAASIIAHLVLCAIIVDAHSPECAAFGTWGAE